MGTVVETPGPEVQDSLVAAGHVALRALDDVSARNTDWLVGCRIDHARTVLAEALYQQADHQQEGES